MVNRYTISLLFYCYISYNVFFFTEREMELEFFNKKEYNSYIINNFAD